MTAALAQPGLFRGRVGMLPGLFDEIAVDLFAGGGGMSLAWEIATGRCVDEAINHDADAIWMHQANHRNTRHWRDSVWRVDPLEVADGRPVGWLHGSPDCTHFSIARGGKPVKKEIRGLAWCVLRWTAKLLPRLLTMENVREFLTWGPLVQKRAGRNRYLWEITRPGARGKHKVRFSVEGPHCDDGSARGFARTLEALGYRVEPLMVPDRRRAGETFRQWHKQLQDLGYEVEWKVLDAADYGAPTHRRRLFVVARRDGQPIRWPEKTHGKAIEGAESSTPVGRDPNHRWGGGANISRGLGGNAASPWRPTEPAPGTADPRSRGREAATGAGLRPYRTAAECIDFTLRCPSIFSRKKDLAENTLRRIVRGLVKFSINSSDPYIVRVDRGGPNFRGQAIHEPFPTLCADHGFGLTVPYTVGAGGRSPDPRAVWRPAGTILPKDAPSLILAHVTQYNGIKGGETRGFYPRRPFNVIPCDNRFGLVGAFLYDRYGERRGQDPRCREVGRPLGAITGTANGGNLVVPLLYTNVIGQQPGQRCDRPLGAITTVHNKFNLLAPYLVEFANSTWSNGHRGVAAPMPTITATPKGGSWSVVSPLAVKFYKSGIVKRVDGPLDSITSRDRFGYAAAQLTKLRGSGGWLSFAEPLDTICAGAATFGLTSAYVVKHYGGPNGNLVIGQDARDPIGTITAKDHHGVVTAWLTHLRGTHGQGVGGSGLSMLDVVPTITAGGGHLYLTTATLCSLAMDNSPRTTDQTIFTPRELMGPSEDPTVNRGFWRVYDLLRRFLGSDAPLPIVRRDGVEYLIYDIGMRMLTPRELLNAQFGPELAKDYVLTGSRESQVAKIGNSVPPLLGAAVVRANWFKEESGVAA